MGDARHADFGVAHGCRVVAIHRTKVALAIYQHVTQRKILCHAHDGVIHGSIAVWMIFADYIADDARGFFIRTVPVVRELVHGEKCPPMDRLQTITHIRQGPSYNHAHGVVEVGTAHLLFEADGERFFRELIHCYIFLSETISYIKIPASDPRRLLLRKTVNFSMPIVCKSPRYARIHAVCNNMI